MIRIIQAEAARRDAADVRNVRRLGHHDPSTSGGAGAQVLDVPIAAQTIGGAVLAHRCDDDAVAGGDRAEADRLEKQGRRHAVRCSSAAGGADP